MNLMRSNWLLLGLYVLVCLVVFIAALVFPVVRQIAPAPLRDLILPPPTPIVINLLYSTEKEAWLDEMIPAFYATQPRIQGRPIMIKGKAMGSREMVLAVLDGKEKPDIISPASSLQSSILQDQSAVKFNRSLVNSNDQSVCPPVLQTPLVLVAWRERAEALWGDTPPPDVWRLLHDALTDPQGWGVYGHPEWGYIKFGHTNPLLSNSGFMTLVLMSYDYFGKTSGLTSADILSDPAYQKWLVEIESTISKFGDSTGTYMKDIVAYGPSVYDIVAVYEATAFEQADNARGRYGQLRVYYPPATILSDHPFCIVNADWVLPEQQQAAQLFLQFLLSRSAQEAALLRYGFRPVDLAVPLDQSGSPLVQYASTGFELNLPPLVDRPAPDALNTLLDFWARQVNR